MKIFIFGGELRDVSANENDSKVDIRDAGSRGLLQEVGKTCA